MESNQQFLKDQYQFGKDVLDHKCAIQLQWDQNLLDIFIAKILSEPSHNILLSSLHGLPITSILLFASHSKYNRKCMLTWYYYDFE